MYLSFRLPVSGDKYQVTKMLANIEGGKPYLGRLQNAICFGIIVRRKLRVWILNESSGKIEWVLKYQDDLLPHAQCINSFYNNGEPADGPWIVEEDSSGLPDSDDNSKTATNENFEWDSDSADFLSFEVGASDDNTKQTLVQQNFDWHSVNDEDGDDEYCRSGTFDILGFHPYKEVVFLVEPFGAGAHDLNSSKIRYLGNSCPKTYDQSQSNGIFESFVYTPRMIGELQTGIPGQSSS